MKQYNHNGLQGCVKQIKPILGKYSGCKLAGIYHAEQADLDPDGGPWVTVCETHGTICCHKTLTLARNHLPLLMWCGQCQDNMEDFSDGR